MGQQEVYDFLMKHPDNWFTSKQISEQLIVSIGSVTMSLKKLRKTNIIKYRNTGKRNTFQYMVQSEPAKLAERKMPLLEIQGTGASTEPLASTKLKVRIKPKIVHQHTYLGGQTFYGVIRPKEEIDAIEKQRDATPQRMTKRRTLIRTSKKKQVKPTKRAVRGRVSAKKAAARKSPVRQGAAAKKRRGAKR